MNLTGQITVSAPREAVFEALRDVPFFASCIDGVSDLVQTGESTFDAVLATKVAYMNFKFKVAIELTRVQPPDEIEARIEGTPLGIVGRLTAISSTRLTESGDGTKVSYAIDTKLAGKLGSIGQPVMKSKAKEMEKQFAERLRAAFAQPGGPKAK
ncbi:MAG: SRPBCC domain-containing protein [Betaproteobacteria bacterium]|nr:SRPBCC domain-containing protein [Betaproteobacteria bacterium]